MDKLSSSEGKPKLDRIRRLFTSSYKRKAEVAVENSSQARVEHTFDEVAFREKVRKLRGEFPPERVKLIEPQTSFYHHSRNPENLVLENKFDPSKSDGGGEMWFIDSPANHSRDVLTNIEAVTMYPTVIFDATRPDRIPGFRVLDEIDAYMERATDAGFDGFIFDGTSMYVPPGAKTVVYYPQSLNVFTGGIRAYKRDINQP